MVLGAVFQKQHKGNKISLPQVKNQIQNSRVADKYSISGNPLNFGSKINQ
jgi:hypothetical protein